MIYTTTFWIADWNWRSAFDVIFIWCLIFFAPFWNQFCVWWLQNWYRSLEILCWLYSIRCGRSQLDHWYVKTWRQSRLMQIKTWAHLFWCSGKQAQKLVSNSNPKMLRRLNWTWKLVFTLWAAPGHLCLSYLSIWGWTRGWLGGKTGQSGHGFRSEILKTL